MSVIEEIKALLDKSGAKDVQIRHRALSPGRLRLRIRFTIGAETIELRACPEDLQRRKRWSIGDIATMHSDYANTPTPILAERLGRPVNRVYAMAATLGLHKSEDYLASEAAARFRKGRRRSQGTEFKPGQVPWNKGRKMPDEIRRKCAPTMFKPGRPAHEQSNYRPIGSLRVTKDGALERKVTDDRSIVPARRWTPVARLVWEAAHGPIPAGHAVAFRPGMHTTVEAEITIDRLELVSRAELLRRNSIHAYGPEVARIHQLRGAITRKIRNRQRKAQP